MEKDVQKQKDELLEESVEEGNDYRMLGKEDMIDGKLLSVNGRNRKKIVGIANIQIARHLHGIYTSLCNKDIMEKWTKKVLED